ncbi:hypothetical protein [Mesorhizobium kowhaii]|uniref:hypothetical protein n=1 Tax=Mesorhizobium kowhaii TaxID=1300272 RepID=UPI00142E6079|nr:hypothetical protein [Mesorhizobium kowhaii]
MIVTFHAEIAKSGPVYRAARLELLRQQMMRHFERTDTAADKVEQMLVRFAEASTLGN